MFTATVVLALALLDRSAQPAAQETPRAQTAAEETQQPPDPQGKKAEAKEPPTPAHTGIRALVENLVEDVKHLPAKQNLYLTLIGGGLAAAVHPADQGFNVRLRSHYDTVNAAFAPGKYVGNTPELIAGSIGTYAFGRLFDKPKVAHLGMDLVQAQILTELLVEPIKFATQRTRPDGSNRHSFPSGHAAITFASATVIERHLGWRKSLLGYTIASYVAASRLHENRHYLSDVVFGAAMGIAGERTVMRSGRYRVRVAPAAGPKAAALMIVVSPGP